MKNVNRLKVVLVERRKTGKWLAEQLGKDPSTVSKWCSNTTQPPLDILVNIAKLLEVDIKDLINEKSVSRIGLNVVMILSKAKTILMTTMQ